MLFDEDRVECLGRCLFGVGWVSRWIGVVGMERYIDPSVHLAAYLNRVGEYAGDLAGNSYDGVMDNAFGELAFAAFAPKAIKAILPYLGERPDMRKYNLYQASQEHGLLMHDVEMVADNRGKVTLSRDQLMHYKHRARMINDSGRDELSLTGGLQHRQVWKSAADTYKQILDGNEQSPLPSVSSMPQLTNLVFRAARLTIRHGDADPFFGYGFNKFQRNATEIGERYHENNVVAVSDALGKEMMDFSNILADSDPDEANKRGVLYFYDTNNVSLAGRAAAQVLALSCLKVARSGDVKTAALMSDVAYCGGAMVMLGHERYRDEYMSRVVTEWQWGTRLGEADPRQLEQDPQHFEKIRQKMFDLAA